MKQPRVTSDLMYFNYAAVFGGQALCQKSAIILIHVTPSFYSLPLRSPVVAAVVLDNPTGKASPK